MIFLTEYNSVSGRTVIFEEDANTGWAYLTEQGNNTIFLDSWVYNRISAPHKNQIEKYRNCPPPAPIEVIKHNLVFEELDSDNISFRWNKSGNVVSIIVGNAEIARLDAVEKKSYNKNLSQNCAWGYML